VTPYLPLRTRSYCRRELIRDKVAPNGDALGRLREVYWGTDNKLREGLIDICIGIFMRR
jgi:hypothetical protein